MILTTFLCLRYQLHMVGLSSIIAKYRWAYAILVISLTIQSYFLYLQDIRYTFLLAMALIPGILYLAVVRYSDVGSKEPRGVIAFHIWIGILLIYPAIYLETLGLKLLIEAGVTPDYQLRSSSFLFWLLFAIVVVAPVEEGLKFIGTLVGNLFHSENDEATDSIVYSVAIATGFALFENYRYVFQSVDQLSFNDSYVLAVARSLTAIPLHLGMGLLMGYYLSGYYHPDKFKLSRLQKSRVLFRSLVYPIIFHGIYDVIVFFIFFNFYLQVLAALIFISVLTYFIWKQVIELRKGGHY